MEQAPASVHAWLALMRAQAAILDGIEQDVVPVTGIPLAWSEVLHRLWVEPDGQLRMQDLARSILLSRSGLTRLADRMEAAGLIERAACPTDRRGTFARITEAGRDLVERGRPAFTASIEARLEAHLTPDEREVLHAVLDRLADANPSDRVPASITVDPPKSVDGVARAR